MISEFNQSNSDGSIEMEPDSCWVTVRSVVLHGLASVGLVALCILAGFLYAINR